MRKCRNAEERGDGPFSAFDPSPRHNANRQRSNSTTCVDIEADVASRLQHCVAFDRPEI